MDRVLLPHQIKPVSMAAGRRNLALFMDMRLGKNTVTIHWVRSLPDLATGRGIVVAPYSAHLGWATDLRANGEQFRILAGSRGERVEGAASAISAFSPRQRGWIITNSQTLFTPKGTKIVCGHCDGKGRFWAPNYDDYVDCGACDGKGKVSRGWADPTEIATFPWDFVVWDESTSLRIPGTQTNDIAFKTLHYRPHKAILSGEYAPEGPLDVFEQMRWLDGSFMGFRNWFKFRNKKFMKVGYDWCPRPGTLRLMREVLGERAIILSRKAAGLAEVKETITRTCRMPPSYRKHFDYVKKKWALPTPEHPETKYAIVAANWMTQMAGGFPKDIPELESTHKLDLLEEIVTKEYPREPLVVMFAFNRELAACLRRLKERAVRCAGVTGLTPPAARDRVCEAFNAGRLRVLMVQTKVARFGLDLSKASTLIRYSPSSSYEDMSQSRSRIIHPIKLAQRVPLLYLNLATQDTPDEIAYQAYGDKRVTARLFMQKVKKWCEKEREL